MPDFDQKNRAMIARMKDNFELELASRAWYDATEPYQYSYHFKWLGRPVIQYPQDLLAAQELIWDTKPDLIVETGIARGGSLIFYASLLELLGGDGQVVGVDIDIREHNRVEIEKHPMFKRITMIEGSSIAPEVVAKVQRLAQDKKRIMLVLDSNHTHDHVLEELKLYSPLVGRGMYLIVCDTVVEFMRPEALKEKPWGAGQQPPTPPCASFWIRTGASP